MCKGYLILQLLLLGAEVGWRGSRPKRAQVWMSCHRSRSWDGCFKNQLHLFILNSALRSCGFGRLHSPALPVRMETGDHSALFSQLKLVLPQRTRPWCVGGEALCRTEDSGAQLPRWVGSCAYMPACAGIGGPSGSFTAANPSAQFMTWL